MKLLHLVRFINSFKGYGVTYEYIKNNLKEPCEKNIEEEDLKRLISSALDLNYIKKYGRGRGLKYYDAEFEIVDTTKSVKKVDDTKLVDGVINVSKCATAKEKVKVVLESNHPLSQPLVFSYRERLLDKTTNRELRDFINDGINDVDVKVAYNSLKKKNYIYSQQNKKKYNQIMIGKNKDGILTVTRIMDGSQSYKEEKTFDDWISLEKYLRTLLPK